MEKTKEFWFPFTRYKLRSMYVRRWSQIKMIENTQKKIQKKDGG
jgi:hypothetical protein